MRRGSFLDVLHGHRINVLPAGFDQRGEMAGCAMNINGYEYCEKCGKPYYYIGDPIGNWEDNICKCGSDKKLSTSPVAHGWQCPICGNVMAPWVAQCPGYHGSIITSTDNVTVAP